jgi:hypothetical protein
MEQVKEIDDFGVAGFDGEDHELLIMDGYDDCIEGVVERFGMNPIVCYDKEKVLNKLRKEMSEEEAYEWFEFNQIGAWLGDATPCFLTKGEKS